MAKYLITGGAGFIGSHLAKKLVDQKHEVIILDNLSTGKLENIDSRCKFIEGSVTNQNVVNIMPEVDFCFHLAAIPSVQSSITDWAKANFVNLHGSVNIFEQAAINQVPVIYASSAAVYGNPITLPLAEEDTSEVLSPYAYDKYSIEQQAKLFYKIKGLRSIGLRFFNVYGPKQDPSSPYSGVISIFFNRIAQGKDIAIFGDGNQIRDFIYVADTVEAMVKACDYIEQTENEVMNVSTGRGTTLNELVTVLKNILNKEPKIDYQPPAKGDINKSIGNPTKMNKLLGFSANTNIEIGLKKLAEYYK